MHVIISTEVTLTIGPTFVGDENANKDLMNYLEATKVTAKCQSYKHYEVPDSPREVLDKLEKIGFRLVGTCGLGQTMVWTLHTDKRNPLDNIESKSES